MPRSLAVKDSPKYAELHAVVFDEYNLRPSIKIVNNIKGNLLPCEWEEQKVSRVYKAIYTYKLDSYELSLLKKLLEKWIKAPIVKPCNKCGLALNGLCNKIKYKGR